MKNDRDERLARAEMEAAKEKSENEASGNTGPRRYKIYDRIKDHVSLRAVDTVIIVTSLLIIAALIVGIVTGTPPK